MKKVTRVIRALCVTTLVIAVLGIILSSLFGDHRTYEVAVTEIKLQQSGETICPLSTAELSRASDFELRACAEHGLMGYVAAKQYPHSDKVFATYAGIPEFHDILGKHGPQVMPIVQYFMEHGSKVMVAQMTIANAWDQLKNGKDITTKPVTLSAEQYGLLAILAIKKGGNGFLEEFVDLNDGTVERLLTVRALSIIKDLIAGGLINVEIKLRRNENIEPKDAAMAALDTFFLAMPMIKGARVLVGFREVEAIALVDEVKLADRAAISWETLSKTSRMVAGKTMGAAKYAAPVVVAYVAVRHPSLISSGGRLIARLMHIPEWIGEVGAWIFVGFVCSPILMTLWALFKVLRLAAWTGGKLTSVGRKLSAA